MPSFKWLTIILVLLFAVAMVGGGILWSLFTLYLVFFLGYAAYRVIRSLVRALGGRRTRQPSTDRSDGSYYSRRITQLKEIKALDPRAFEQFVGGLFRRMGYETEITSASVDEGVDLFLRQKGQTAIVQCKRYEGTVGQPAVRDLFGTMIDKQARRAYLVTTGTFSLPAQQFAHGKPIHLVDGDELVEWLTTLHE